MFPVQSLLKSWINSINIILKIAYHSQSQRHTGQCKSTGGCYNELVVAFFSTGGGDKGKKSIPVDFMIYL